MEIKRINDINEVLNCIPFEQEIRNKGRDDIRISKMLLFVRDQLSNPLFGYWIAYDEDKIVGYTIAIISIIPSIERLHLLRMYAKTKAVRENFEEVLTSWAKKYKIRIAQMTANKHVAALERGYNWKTVSVNLERKI